MSWRGTLFLLLLAGLSVGYFLFSGQNRTHLPETPLLGIDPSLADKIEIHEGGAQISLTKTNGIWMVDGNAGSKNSAADRANPQLISALLGEAADIVPLDILKPSDLKGDVTLGSLGLKNPDRSLSIHAGKDHAATLWIGTQGAAPHSLYARLDSEKAVYLIPGKIASLAFRPVQEYRDPKLTDLQSDQLSEVSLTKNATMQQLALKKDQKDSWHLIIPISCNGDDRTITTWLSTLLASPVKRWMPDDADSSSCGLDLPSATVTLLKTGSTNPVTISIGTNTQESATDYFVKCSDRPGICVLGGTITNALSVTPQTLRSKQITQIDYDTVDRIDMGLYHLKRKPSSNDWIGHTDGQPDEELIPGERVKQWYDKLQGLKVSGFEAATPEHLVARGLSEADHPLTIRLVAQLSENTAQENAGDTLLAQYAFGSTTPNGIAVREGNAADLLILPNGSLEFLKKLHGEKNFPVFNSLSQ